MRLHEIISNNSNKNNLIESIIVGNITQSNIVYAYPVNKKYITGFFEIIIRHIGT